MRTDRINDLAAALRESITAVCGPDKGLALQNAWLACSCWLAGLGFIFSMTACKVGPDYSAPELVAPEAWEARAAGDAIESTAMPLPPENLWWHELEDPQLDRLVEQALEANPNLQAARSRVREARALVGIAESGLLPQVGGRANYAEIELSERTPILEQFIRRGQVDTRQNLYDVGFDAQWEIDVFGGTRRAVEAGVARAAAAEASLADARLSLQMEVIRQYIHLRLAQRQLAILQRQSELQEQIVALAQERLSSGVGAALDLRRAQALEHRIRAQVPGFRIQKSAAIYRISVLTDEEPSELSERLDEVEALPQPPDLVPLGVPGDVLRRRPDIHQAEMRLKAATAEIGVKVAQLFPRFALTGGAGLQASRFARLFESGSGTWTILPGVSWAVFQGGRIRAEVEASGFQEDQAFQSYRQTVNQAVAEVETALTRYGLSFQTRESLRSMVDSQREAAELSKAAHESGVVDFLDVLEAQRQLSKGSLQLAEARGETLLALAALQKALGGGWDTRLDG